MTKKRNSIVDTESIDDIIRDLVKKRGSLKGKFTLFSKFVQSLEASNPTEIQKTELDERLKKIEVVFDQFCSIQDDIDLYVSGSQIDKELQERESFENQYYAIVAKSKCILKESSTVHSDNNNCKSHAHGIKLPTITLPNFDGSYDQWLEFRDTFLSLVHSSKTLDNIQKFHYLRSVLSGNALQVIKALEFSAQNYIVAWDLLENRYNNSRLLVHNHVKALFTVQAINKESAPQIRKLMDAISRNLRALKTLGEPTDTWDTLIIYIIVTKLDSTTEREWELFRGTLTNSSSNKTISLSDLMTFLKDRADFLETVKPSHSKSMDSSQNNHTKNMSSVKTHSHVSTQKDGKKSANHTKSPRYKCNLCSSNHPIYSCDEFLLLSSKDKLKLIDEKNLCRNCLRAGHALADCWFGPCKHCNKKHNTLIHSEFVDANEPSTVSHTAQIVASESTTEITHKNIASSTASRSHTTHTPYKVGNLDTRYFYDQVLLSTALVEIADAENKYHTTRALLDSGSQHCFISEKLCKTLNIPTIQATMQVIGVGNSVTQSTQLCKLKMRSKTSSYNTHINCLVLSQITAQLPSLGIHHKIEIPNNIQLADPDFHSSNEINLLIGADKF
ncbi:uncharacterized protein LOC113508216 [Trichoplusia ni]|uniref:Uncharacterized protein LOC113508216 n=1 Tax=Trichoplusia ni TaxID=7111 RepID=A0A7E5X3G5_TRINI|nr:uncharacterized protein LOC113508216 [Trichoplusia ni]